MPGQQLGPGSTTPVRDIRVLNYQPGRAPTLDVACSDASVRPND